ncbi:MAG: hypothetical protein JST83_10095 [Bacteroidetes bacterium]|nr:hypothetical protein [Bacteroidota bacterium]
MGEFSKKVGDVGEKIVEDFLSLIGWKMIVRNIDIPSIDPEKHGKERHGIDGYYHYKSNLIAKSLENVLISVKYSMDSYPNTPVAKFKDYYKDLAMAIESFKKSEIRHNTLSSRSGYETIFDRGVIFWINNIPDQKAELLSKLVKIELPREYNHDGIFLVENEKVEFIYDSIMFVKSAFPANPLEFTYFNTGFNGDDSIGRSGPIMPVQYFASNILPMRVQVSELEKCLIICTREKFEGNELIKLVGLVKNITSDFQARTIIAFPDYDLIRHEPAVRAAMQTFEPAPSVTVANYNSNFRNFYGETSR